eukprot:285146_1
MATIPCPDRVVDDCGGAFAMGAIGASIWHGVKGYRNTPKGGKFSGCVQAIRQRAPVTGGAFALWGLSFSTFDCAIAKYRKKEDPWNAIMAGAATGGLLAARSGYKAVLMQAAFGGIFLAMIEGMGIAIGNSMSKKRRGRGTSAKSLHVPVSLSATLHPRPAPVYRDGRPHGAIFRG